jgi:NAD(P)-dependent dehydrogenase (short-subunit alcohol dehydrogenase family)
MNKNFNITNKVVIVTGAAGLLAEQHVEVILENKAIAILLDINKNKLEEKKKYYLKKYQNAKIEIFVGDITCETFILTVKLKVINKYKKIDVLINNAAVDYKIDKKHKRLISKTQLENFDIDLWQKDLNVGLTGSLICTKYFGCEMAKRKSGIILNIASDLSIIAPDNRIYNSGKNNFLKNVKPVSYSVVKHGIIGLTKYTSAYWADKNIRCNALAPGGIRTNQPRSFVKKISKLIPMKRMAKKGEYKSSILFLISEASSYMNGAVVVVDGGRTIL